MSINSAENQTLRLSTREITPEWQFDGTHGYDPVAKTMVAVAADQVGVLAKRINDGEIYPQVQTMSDPGGSKGTSHIIITGRIFVSGLTEDAVRQALGDWQVNVSWLHGVAIIESNAKDLPRIAAFMEHCVQQGIEAELELAATVEPLSTPTDPLVASQWHFAMMNVAGAWNNADRNVSGAGVTLAVVDQGVENVHEDLTNHVLTTIDRDVLDNDADTSPGPANENGYEAHGTWVSGVAAGAGNNGKGIAGVAYDADIIPIRILGIGGTILTDGKKAEALGYRITAVSGPVVDVSNNSWGPSNNAQASVPLASIIRQAFSSGATNGRAGKGIVYIFAAGNGRSAGDDASWIGQNNDRHVITVGALAINGTQAVYSDSGTNLFITAPGGGGSLGGIVTTDLKNAEGLNDGDYTQIADVLQGTSFAAPAVSGVVCLMLEMNPNLTWRDVRHILRETAITDVGAGWQINGWGQPFHHGFGYGKIDASAAVAASRGWRPTPTAVGPYVTTWTGSDSIPDNDATGLTRNVTLATSANFRIETVELQVDIAHAFAGDLELLLTSPDGTEARIPRRTQAAGSVHHTFICNAFAGEVGAGQWTLKVADRDALALGTLTQWKVSAYGYNVPGEPVIIQVNPQRILPASTGNVLTITGTKFTTESVVLWDGTELVTTYVSATQVTAVVPNGLIPATGTSSAEIHVYTPPFLTEGGGLSAGSLVLISQPPTIVINQASPYSFAEDTVGTFTVSITDPDSDLSGITVYGESANTQLIPNGRVSVTDSGGTRTVTLRPLRDRNGSAVLTFYAADSYLGDSVSAQITVTVTGVDDPPYVQDQVIRVGASGVYHGQWQVIDPEGDPWTVAEVTAAPFVVPLATTGGFSFNNADVIANGGAAVWTVAATGSGGTGPIGTATILASGPGGKPFIASEPNDEELAPGSTLTWQINVDRRELGVDDSLKFRILRGPAGVGFGSHGGADFYDSSAPGNTAVLKWNASGTDRVEPVIISVQRLIGIDATPGNADVSQVLIRIRAVSSVD